MLRRHRFIFERNLCESFFPPFLRPIFFFLVVVGGVGGVGVGGGVGGVGVGGNKSQRGGTFVSVAPFLKNEKK